MAPKMGVGWEKIRKGCFALIQLEEISCNPAEMKSRLVDHVKQFVVRNGGSAVSKHAFWDLPMEFRVYMQGQLGSKHLDCIEEDLREAGVVLNSSKKRVHLEGVSEAFDDAMYVQLKRSAVLEARSALSKALQLLPPSKQTVTSDEFGSFLDKLSGTLGPEQIAEQQARPGYQKLLPARQRLPAFQQASDIIESVRNNSVVLVLGATGCGKTTQIPQLLLEDLASQGEECRIIATQPRRISAFSVAERVAAERGEKLGKTVGYKVRFEDSVGPSTQLVFCTVGILLKIMQSNKNIDGATHLVIDEVHERDLHTDFLLSLVRRVLDCRPDLKVVLMSATVDPSAFQNYFEDAVTVEIPGKTNYLIEELFVEDLLRASSAVMNSMDANEGGGWGGGWQKSQAQSSGHQLEVPLLAPTIKTQLGCSSQIAAAVAQIHSAPADKINYGLIAGVVEFIHTEKGEGAVLIFVPGWFEITEVMKRLQACSVGKDLEVFPLHSRIPSADQQAIFRPATSGKRKVIVSTVLAETSITVEDVVFVVDSGRNKSTFFNESSLISALKTVWYSKANGLQRRGRAGRCRPGAWYRLYSSLQWKEMLDYELPEMLRSPLEELCLEVASLRLGPPAEFLAASISPPNPAVAKHAVDLLHNLGAVEDASGEVLTPLGWKLSKLQVHPMLGKMLLLGSLFRCYQPVMTICASLGYKSPFVCPMGKEKEANEAKKRLAGDSNSDLFALASAYDGWQHGKWRFAQQNFLSSQTLEYIVRLRQDLTEAARDVLTNVVSDHDDPLYLQDVCRAVLVAGLYPNIAWLGKRDKAEIMGGLNAKVHPGSVNAGRRDSCNEILVFYDIQETTDRWMYDTTVVGMAPVLLFAPNVQEIMREGERALFSIGSWRVCVDSAIADDMLELRELTVQFINRSVGHTPTAVHTAATDALTRLFSDHAPVVRNDDDEDEDETASVGSNSNDKQAPAKGGGRGGGWGAASGGAWSGGSHWESGSGGRPSRRVRQPTIRWDRKMQSAKFSHHCFANCLLALRVGFGRRSDCPSRTPPSSLLTGKSTSSSLLTRHERSVSPWRCNVGLPWAIQRH
eukprot:TRINITY_DN57764_c0_g1_i1.p1 TRINITY_DN57764_c0_g1~~TRINITY_DN57764_c0_g1_i1.p1  ORF type:complete len:1174 (+),score=171.27 TRINITY_DN57764_c0_g1_i1:284-3523(+)